MVKRTRRTFTSQFKAEIVLAILSGSQSKVELCRQYNLKPEFVSLWRKKLPRRLPNVVVLPE